MNCIFKVFVKVEDILAV